MYPKNLVWRLQRRERRGGERERERWQYCFVSLDGVAGVLRPTRRPAKKTAGASGRISLPLLHLPPGRTFISSRCNIKAHFVVSFHRRWRLAGWLTTGQLTLASGSTYPRRERRKKKEKRRVPRRADGEFGRRCLNTGIVKNDCTAHCHVSAPPPSARLRCDLDNNGIEGRTWYLYAILPRMRHLTVFFRFES